MKENFLKFLPSGSAAGGLCFSAKRPFEYASWPARWRTLVQTGLFLLPIYAACAPVGVKRSRVTSEQLVFTCAGGAGPARLKWCGQLT